MVQYFVVFEGIKATPVLVCVSLSQKARERVFGTASGDQTNAGDVSGTYTCTCTWVQIKRLSVVYSCSLVYYT